MGRTIDELFRCCLLLFTIVLFASLPPRPLDTFVRDVLLRVLLGRLYTLSLLLPRLLLICVGVFRSRLGAAPARTPASALDGPDVLGA